ARATSCPPSKIRSVAGTSWATLVAKRCTSGLKVTSVGVVVSMCWSTSSRGSPTRTTTRRLAKLARFAFAITAVRVVGGVAGTGGGGDAQVGEPGGFRVRGPGRARRRGAPGHQRDVRFRRREHRRRAAAAVVAGADGGHEPCPAAAEKQQGAGGQSAHAEWRHG